MECGVLTQLDGARQTVLLYVIPLEELTLRTAVY